MSQLMHYEYEMLFVDPGRNYEFLRSVTLPEEHLESLPRLVEYWFEYWYFSNYTNPYFL